MENIIIVHRPELTPEEYAERMARIKKAAEDLVRATEREKARKKRSTT